MKIRMKYKKSTKNTFVFNEIDAMGNEVKSINAKIPSLYIRKTALKGPAQIITVTVEVENGN